MDQLSDSIRESERVMAVITDSFISDPWCVLQFTLAMRERLTQPVSGLIGETEGSKGQTVRLAVDRDKPSIHPNYDFDF